MPRFRLRTFLLAITAFCLLLGWRVAAVESVERSIRELEKLGWELQYNVRILDHPTRGGRMIENAPRRNFWQKLCMGYRTYDLPLVASLGSESKIGTRDEIQQAIEEFVSWSNRLSSLKVLDLSDMQLTGACIEPLTSCEYICFLYLNATNVDDSHIDHLSKLRQLEYIELLLTNFSAEGIAELQRRLPACHIAYDYNDH